MYIGRNLNLIKGTTTRIQLVACIKNGNAILKFDIFYAQFVSFCLNFFRQQSRGFMFGTFTNLIVLSLPNSVRIALYALSTSRSSSTRRFNPRLSRSANSARTFNSECVLRKCRCVLEKSCLVATLLQCHAMHFRAFSCPSRMRLCNFSISVWRTTVRAFASWTSRWAIRTSSLDSRSFPVTSFSKVDPLFIRFYNSCNRETFEIPWTHSTLFPIGSPAHCLLLQPNAVFLVSVSSCEFFSTSTCKSSVDVPTSSLDMHTDVRMHVSY